MLCKITATDGNDLGEIEINNLGDLVMFLASIDQEKYMVLIELSEGKLEFRLHEGYLE